MKYVLLQSFKITETGFWAFNIENGSNFVKYVLLQNFKKRDFGRVISTLVSCMCSLDWLWFWIFFSRKGWWFQVSALWSMAPNYSPFLASR